MEKPDYYKIERLELELGYGQLQDLIEAGADTQTILDKHESLKNHRDIHDVYVESFMNAIGRMPTQQEQTSLSVLVGTTYERLINDCTSNPRWWEVDERH